MAVAINGEKIIFSAYRLHKSTNARFVCGLGFLAGVTYAVQSSCQRLMGLYENASEVNRYGALSAEQLAEANKRLAFPAQELISPPLRLTGKKPE